MKKIEVFDAAAPGPGDASDPDADRQLAGFAADVEWARQRGARIERFDLAQQPDAFADNPLVRNFLEHSGQQALPLVLVDDAFALAGRYPTRAELARWSGIAAKVMPKIAPAGACGCGGKGC